MIALYKNSMYKPIFWIVFALLSLLGIIFTYSFFSKTFPIVDLKITMDRELALEKSSRIAQELHLKPENYMQAVSFDADSEVQNYVELEAGGPKALRQMLQENYFVPFFWRVRHFKEYDPAETEFFFKPDGTPYGFIQQISENEPGAALSQQEAEVIARAQASEYWGVNFDIYNTVEKAQEVMPNGRIDHTFVYEHTTKKVGQAPYRLKLVVRGNALTELKLSVKVPEAFKRKYQEMRSFNTTIALTALIIMILIYVFCCGFIGLYYLARWNLIEWRWPLLCGVLLGSLSVISSINEIPFFWFNYHTAISLHQFIGYILIRLIYQFFIYTVASTLLFIVAEGLTRRAFPHHIQFWKLWSSTAASSREVLGRTLGGYLIVGTDFAYAIAFYYSALHYFGWWSPSESLYDPNALATYVPWITPIVNSLSAGVLEEALFRALPLASAALLGNRYGKKNLWIFAAFILQMIVFGAAHANYPAQPSYARLIELLLPSAVFGVLYLRFGLLSAMLSHYIYDVCWFALPIFISHAPGILFDKAMIILISLVPLFVVLYHRIRNGAWITLPSVYYNIAWNPVATQETQQEIERPVVAALPRSWYMKIGIAGGVGLLSWLLLSSFGYHLLPLTITRMQARDHAQKLVQETTLRRTPLTTVESSLESNDRNQHIFIWNTVGKELYKKLLHSYLVPPAWKVRLVHFDGDIADRADEYELLITGDKQNSDIRRIHHTLPEAAKRNSLTKEQARDVAVKSIQEKYGLDEKKLQEISAIPKQLPERLDWKFTFNDITQRLPAGQARITVEIAGDEIVDCYRFIFVPEQWERKYKDATIFVELMTTIEWLLLALLMLVIGAILVRSLRSLHFSTALFMFIAFTLAIKSCIQAFNIWPIAISQFVTSKPFSHQVWGVVSFWLVYGLFMAVALGIIAGLLQNCYCKSAQSNMRFSGYIVFGMLLGFIEVGLYSAITYYMPTTIPTWPSMAVAGALWPWLSQALTMLTSFIQYTLFALACLVALDKVTHGGRDHTIIAIISLIILGCVLFEFKVFTPLFVWIFAAIAWAVGMWLIYYYGLRHVRASIPVMIATKKIAEAIPLIVVNPFPGAVLGAIIGSMVLFIYSCYWSYQLYKNR